MYTRVSIVSGAAARRLQEHGVTACSGGRIVFRLRQAGQGKVLSVWVSGHGLSRGPVRVRRLRGAYQTSSLGITRHVESLLQWARKADLHLRHCAMLDKALEQSGACDKDGFHDWVDAQGREIVYDLMTPDDLAWWTAAIKERWGVEV